MTQTLATETQRAKFETAKEMSLRIDATGKGGVGVRAIVPAEVLSSIESGDLPVETELKIKVPGYGWRVVGVRIFPSGEGRVSNGTRSVGLSIPGCDHAPLRMAFLGRTGRG